MGVGSNRRIAMPGNQILSAAPAPRLSIRVCQNRCARLAIVRLRSRQRRRVASRTSSSNLRTMRALIVDDEQNIRRTLSLALESMGYETTNAGNGPDALRELKARRFDVMLLDLKLSQESGLDRSEEAIRISPALAVVIMTAFASIDTAVEAMRRGAFDYLPKPCTPEQLRQVLGRIQKTRKLERRVAELESRLSADSPEIDLTTHSPVMKRAFDVAFKAAGTDATVLLLGESGTGKSVLARAIHQRSSRNNGAFVTVSCPSLTRELLQSELFGHVKGAFTGALAETWGKVTAAEGGTLFLDEVGDLPPETQEIGR